jgi:hypothetical protein
MVCEKKQVDAFIVVRILLLARLLVNHVWIRGDLFKTLSTTKID